MSMGALSQSINRAPSPLAWFKEFLKEELAPYPGRAALVARVVLAASIAMILTMIFRMPYGAYCAIYAFTMSRESPEATVEAFKTLVASLAFSVLYVLLGAILFLGDPDLRLLWVIASFFVMFYALSTMTNYTAAARFGYLLIITVPLWDEHTPAGLRVEGTLWAFGAITLGSAITLAIELVFAEFTPRDDLVQAISERLVAIEELLGCFVATRPVDAQTTKHITHLAMLGTSRLRRTLQRAGYSPTYEEQMGAVLVLAGRLVDIAANVADLSLDISDADRERIRTLAENIAGIRHDLATRRVPRLSSAHKVPMSPTLPLLREMQKIIALSADAFAGAQSWGAYSPPPSSTDPRRALLVLDALSNPEHVEFALKGCLAASLCYIFYNAKSWPGIGTAVTTCFLTALTTVGASHQKQILRITGAIAGGVVLGIGAQILVMPYLDSLAGFTLLFLTVTIPAAWIATSGPRLSYLGSQIVVAFYLINLSEFRVQTSLVPGRDRVLGILLGLAMMWLVFDQLWGSPAIVQMKKVFTSNLRLLAQFVREPVSQDLIVAIEQSYSLRETINKNFASARNYGDGVALEFGSSRQQDLVWRSHIVGWQLLVRAVFLTQIALWKYRARLPGFDLPEPVHEAQKEFDHQVAITLDSIANQMEGKSTGEKAALESSVVHPEQVIRRTALNHPQEAFGAQLQALLILSRRIETLVSSLAREI
jgi:multidrug resistance protein MdtO